MRRPLLLRALIVTLIHAVEAAGFVVSFGWRASFPVAIAWLAALALAAHAHPACMAPGWVILAIAFTVPFHVHGRHADLAQLLAIAAGIALCSLGWAGTIERRDHEDDSGWEQDAPAIAIDRVDLGAAVPLVTLLPGVVATAIFAALAWSTLHETALRVWGAGVLAVWIGATAGFARLPPSRRRVAGWALPLAPAVLYAVARLGG